MARLVGIRRGQVGHGKAPLVGAAQDWSRLGVTPLGMVGRGTAPLGRTWRVSAGQDSASHGQAPRVKASQDWVRPGLSPLLSSWLDAFRRASARLVRTRHGQAWPGTARPGSPLRGVARIGKTRRGWTWHDLVRPGMAPLALGLTGRRMASPGMAPLSQAWRVMTPLGRLWLGTGSGFPGLGSPLPRLLFRLFGARLPRRQSPTARRPAVTWVGRRVSRKVRLVV